MKFWLLKSEPETFSIDDLSKKGRSQWDGVRNFEARNNLTAMKKGDLFIFYHSSVQPAGAVGVGKILKESYPDPTQFTKSSPYFDKRATPEKPLWFAPDVGPVCKFPEIVTLAQMRDDKALSSMRILMKGSRLSVTPLEQREFKRILQIAECEKLIKLAV